MTARLFGIHMRKKHTGFRNFAYLFAHILPANAEDYGTAYDPNKLMAYHSSELFFAFSSLRENFPPARAWKEADYRLADQMSTYWANFIRSGDPSGADRELPEWKDSSDGSYMVFSDRPESHRGFMGILDSVISAFVQNNYFA